MLVEEGKKRLADSIIVEEVRFTEVSLHVRKDKIDSKT